MYKNVGREIKTWTKARVIIAALPSWLIALLLVYGGITANSKGIAVLFVVLGVAVAYIGYVRARFKGMEKYAFGELVESTEIIRDTLRAMAEQHDQRGSSFPASTSQASAQQAQVWKCSCGADNASGLFCTKCGKHK